MQPFTFIVAATRSLSSIFPMQMQALIVADQAIIAVGLLRSRFSRLFARCELKDQCEQAGHGFQDHSIAINDASTLRAPVKVRRPCMVR